MRNNPVASYIIGGIVLSTLRESAIRDYYAKHYHRFDLERKRELEEFLANGGTPQQVNPDLL
jgi:predicted solute-binding protein